MGGPGQWGPSESLGLGAKPACSSDSEWLGLGSGATVGVQSESGVILGWIHGGTPRPWCVSVRIIWHLLGENQPVPVTLSGWG